MYPTPDQYPDSIQIRDKNSKWHTWEIEFHERRIPGENRRILGVCEYAPTLGIRTIHLRLPQSPKNLFHTYCHELAHVFENELGFEIDHKKLDILAGGFAQCFVTNFVPMMMLADVARQKVG